MRFRCRVPATMLAHHGPLHQDDIAQRLHDAGVADPDVVLDEIGCPARPAFDDEPLVQRGIPAGAVHPLGALLLAPGTLQALGVAEGDLVGVRVTEQGLRVERITGGADSAVGARLAATLKDDEPVHFDAAVRAADVGQHRGRSAGPLRGERAGRRPERGRGRARRRLRPR